MEPIPETVRALEMLEPVEGQADHDLVERFRAAGRYVLAKVPDCVGYSISRVDDDLVFTMIASAEDVAVLDATQYLDDGPCVQSVRRDEVVHVKHPLDEDRWRVFADAGAGIGVRSTLTMPIHDDDARVTGSVNLYARTTDAFDGHHDYLAYLFGAWAQEAVTNADLSFSTYRQARRAPRILVDQSKLHAAVQLLAARLQVDDEQARRRLQQAAELAGLSESVLARAVISLYRGAED